MFDPLNMYFVSTLIMLYLEEVTYICSFTLNHSAEFKDWMLQWESNMLRLYSQVLLAHIKETFLCYMTVDRLIAAYFCC